MALGKLLRPANKNIKNKETKVLPKPSSPKKYDVYPYGIVLYGPSGVGKTDFAANLPNPGFLIDSKEIGIRELTDFGICKSPEFIETAETFTHALDVVEQVALRKLKCDTLCLDALTGFQLLCFQEHCENYYGGDWTKEGFFAYQSGPKNAAATDWPRLLDGLTNVRNAGVNVCLIGHSTVKPYDNPEGPNYDRFVCFLEKEIWQATHRWASAIFFYNFVDEIVKEGRQKAKARTDSDQRTIYTVRTAAFDAKNRWGLPPLIDAGDSGETAAANFLKVYRKAANK